MSDTLTDSAQRVFKAARALSPAEQRALVSALEQSLAQTNQTPEAESKLAELERMTQRFWHGPSIEELAREQGVKPIMSLEDLDALVWDFWPEDQSVDDFLNSIREMRRESGDK